MKISKRIPISALSKHIDGDVLIAGHISTSRGHGKIVFLTIRDFTGFVQVVVNDSNLIEIISKLSIECPLKIEGAVIKRSERNIKSGEINGDLEVKAKGVEVLSDSTELPFDLNAELNIDKEFDYRPLTIRRGKEKNIFSIQASILIAIREYFNQQSFVEFQSPKIAGEDAEGGAGSFKVDYLDKDAYLTTSPQLYKQIMVGAFERVFCIGDVFRAEKHATSRHLLEYTSIDFEMGFIDSYIDVMDMLEGLIRHTIEYLNQNQTTQIDALGVTPTHIPKSKFPTLAFEDAKKVLQVEGIESKDDMDLSPAEERGLSKWALEKHESDFVFITRYPLAKRPMYAMPSTDGTAYSETFDLLYRGLEISSGGQRIHKYKELCEALENKKLDVESFEFYLQAFKYGLPPHGGMGMGLERLTFLFIGLSNVKEACLFPREINRIDKKLK